MLIHVPGWVSRARAQLGSSQPRKHLENSLMDVGGRGATAKSAQRWQLDRIWQSCDLGYLRDQPLKHVELVRQD